MKETYPMLNLTFSIIILKNMKIIKTPNNKCLNPDHAKNSPMIIKRKLLNCQKASLPEIVTNVKTKLMIKKDAGVFCKDSKYTNPHGLSDTLWTHKLRESQTTLKRSRTQWTSRLSKRNCEERSTHRERNSMQMWTWCCKIVLNTMPQQQNTTNWHLNFKSTLSNLKKNPSYLNQQEKT